MTISFENATCAHIVAYARAIWRMSAFFIVVAYFVEIVFVELADEACEIAVLEVFWED